MVSGTFCIGLDVSCGSCRGIHERLRFECVGVFKLKGDVESASDLAYCEGVFRGYMKSPAARGNCHWPYTAPCAFVDPFEIGQ